MLPLVIGLYLHPITAPMINFGTNYMSSPIKPCGPSTSSKLSDFPPAFSTFYSSPKSTERSSVAENASTAALVSDSDSSHEATTHIGNCSSEGDHITIPLKRICTIQDEGTLYVQNGETNEQAQQNGTFDSTGNCNKRLRTRAD